ncbi:cuticle protein 7-like [Scylla paramamosain]|uniref:cuticle protein 7-like n=1 Tax=Scylla paramamosain TaxID=85552 RepID=UPI00308344EB
MSGKVVLLLALVAMVAADRRPRPTYGAPPPPPPPPRPTYGAQQESSEEVAPPVYNFQWEVRDEYSGNRFDHQEDREYDNTKGSYSVQLPDGRLQHVTYHVEGDSGYIAEVNYEGEAQYPESDESREYGYGK